jgi:hypothetical protein
MSATRRIGLRSIIIICCVERSTSDGDELELANSSLTAALRSALLDAAHPVAPSNHSSFVRGDSMITDPEGFARTMLVVLGVFCAMLAGLLVIYLLFLRSLQKALSNCSRRNRTMEPARVWLSLIPLFGAFWMFQVVCDVGASLRNELIDRGLDRGGNGGKTIGISWLVASILGATSIYTMVKTGVGLGALACLLWIASLILFIVYWVRVAGYSGQIRRDMARDDRGDEDVDRRPLPAMPDDRIR